MSGVAVEVAPGQHLHVESEGSGPPVFLLHGFTGSGETVRSTAAALGPGWRTLRVDLLGHGRSDRGAGPADYRLERCVADLTRVLDAFGLESAHWLGYSMGARVALGLAVARPERVRSLLLVGGRAGIADRAAREARVRDDEALADRIEARGLEWFVDHWMALPIFASQRRLGAAALAAARAQRLRNDPRALADSLRGLGAGAQPPLFEHLPALDLPVLLAVGVEDERFLAAARELAALLPDARVATVPDAGHAAHLENPTDFALLTRAYLAACEGRRATATPCQGDTIR